MKGLVTISNKDRIIYKFYRRNDKKFYEIDDKFYPYYYEPNLQGKYTSIFGDKLKKIVVSSPNIIAKQRSANSFESDISIVDRYFIDKINYIEKTKLKVTFLDIEVQSEEFPKPEEAKYPVSSISLLTDYNLVNFFLPEFKSEKVMLSKLANYLKAINPDIITGWNISFDWAYLNNRWKSFYKTPFSKIISPIKSIMFRNKMFVPAGIVILDYLEGYKKMFPHGIGEYTLDYILEHEFGEGKKHKITNFNILNEDLKMHNIEDVVNLSRIEEKHHLIDYYDEIRRTACCSWYNVYMNSRIINILVHRQAKKDSVILPSVKKHSKETFKGAYRISNPGLYTKIVRIADLNSAYPTMMIKFNLSPENVGKEGLVINGVSFAQKEGILSRVAKILGKRKAELKKLKEKDKKFAPAYAAQKGIFNSLFGVCGFSSFALYKKEVAATIAFLVRDLLHYIIDNLRLKIIFVDTDGVAYESEEDLTDKFNSLAKKWAKEKYNKVIENVFEAEKPFIKLFNKANCHYIGQYADGTYKIRGMEMKRSSSSKYQSWFQETLIKEFIFKDKSYTETKQWVENEKKRIKTLPLIDISFPAKNKGEYKDFIERDGKRFKKQLPIFVRALQNSKLKKRNGNLYYWLYITTPEKVIAIDDNHTIDKKIVDWVKMEQRNIGNVWKSVCEVMGWNSQKKLF